MKQGKEVIRPLEGVASYPHGEEVMCPLEGVASYPHGGEVMCLLEGVASYPHGGEVMCLLGGLDQDIGHHTCVDQDPKPHISTSDNLSPPPPPLQTKHDDWMQATPTSTQNIPVMFALTPLPSLHPCLTSSYLSTCLYRVQPSLPIKSNADGMFIAFICK